MIAIIGSGHPIERRVPSMTRKTIMQPMYMSEGIADPSRIAMAS